jgi:hypothetical protein
MLSAPRTLGVAIATVGRVVRNEPRVRLPLLAKRAGERLRSYPLLHPSLTLLIKGRGPEL